MDECFDSCILVQTIDILDATSPFSFKTVLLRTIDVFSKLSFESVPK